MDWNFFAVVPVEVQAILQEKEKQPLEKKELKYYLSIVTDSFSFFPLLVGCQGLTSICKTI